MNKEGHYERLTISGYCFNGINGVSCVKGVAFYIIWGIKKVTGKKYEQRLVVIVSAVLFQIGFGIIYTLFIKTFLV